MKKKLSIAGYVIVAIFIVIQFIKPTKNISPVIVADKIEATYNIPDDTHQLLKISCYDCHSNNTNYPWYSRVQPVAWYLDNHIADGKRHLNFDEFAIYPLYKQYKKFREIKELVHDGGMPLYSYTILHPNSALDADKKLKIERWADDGINQLEAKYPFDSLHRKQTF